MKIKFIYKVIPVPLFYVDSLGWAAGRSNGFFVRIVEKYKTDTGLIEHEIQHCRQFYRTLGLHGLLYTFSSRYRYFAEMECYKIQLTYANDKEASIAKFVKFITTRYNLNVDASKVELDLRRS